jgi:alkanesulfonate monooxygenase SsuD/methylene tetrahydromethanopterin reductase-like flavin-dependent oxidoreductase (luciferase family)
MINAWLFVLPEYFGPRPHELGTDPEQAASIYAWNVEQCVRCEALGFTGIFFSEHHVPRYSMGPVPNLLLATVAARTKRVRLGVLASTLPMHAPWRLAEECAMLDNLSRGRLEIGVARGASPEEPAVVGIPPEEIEPRLEEGLTVLRRCFNEYEIDFDGRFTQLKKFSLFPRLYQQPTPPFWIPVMSARSATRAAQAGDRVCAGLQRTAVIKDIFDAYRNAASVPGSGNHAPSLAIRRHMVIAPTDAEAESLTRQHKQLLLVQVEALGDLVSDDEFIFGSPSTVTDKIIHQCRSTGAGHIVLTQFGSLPRAAAEQTITLFGQDVLPRLTADGSKPLPPVNFPLS